ncbi:enoyl-CoA hydratase-related protein [Novosphingobium bradum]|uniref:Enoyl-CoA hydratase-related protein n=1 Tax=Novosphingobium bradum TaxID=1737444 RepID=A0ABV7IR77_9SPHN
MADIWGDAGGEPTILAEVREGVGVVTLNRPARLNAWTPDMGTLYFDTLDQLARNDEVRAILVHGAGRAFCAGADMSGLSGLTETGGFGQARDPRSYWFPMSIGKPIVAAIKGPCYGVGLQQALVADVRFGATDAKISGPYAKRGLIAEVGISWMLSRIVGVGHAMDLMLSGRALTGEEALAMGLINRLVEPDALFDEAFAYARAMAGECSPWSMRMIKQQLYHDLMRGFSPSFQHSEDLLQVAMQGADFREGIAAFRDKRPLDFSPLAPDLARLDPWPEG